jgi:two-component system chemotaxis response regulator CheY
VSFFALKNLRSANVPRLRLLHNSALVSCRGGPLTRSTRTLVATTPLSGGIQPTSLLTTGKGKFFYADDAGSIAIWVLFARIPIWSVVRSIAADPYSAKPAMNILIVDDTALVRLILKRNLMALGVREEEIFQAEDGEKGLACFKTFGCRGIVTDLRMPVMDGVTFVQEVRKLDSQVPIIMLTSANEREEVMAAVESGVTDYLIKPPTAAAMQKKLLKMLAQIEASRVDPANAVAAAVNGQVLR